MKIERNEVCKSCSGTGLYIGMAERDGAAVVCSKCNGTGCFHYVHEYEEFVSRSEPTEPVKRVYQVNPGIVIGEGNYHKLEDFGGMPYEQWKDGDLFVPKTEDRKHTCPQWWYSSVDSKKMPNFDECIESLGKPYSACRFFPVRDVCWFSWDRKLGGEK